MTALMYGKWVLAIVMAIVGYIFVGGIIVSALGGQGADIIPLIAAIAGFAFGYKIVI